VRVAVTGASGLIGRSLVTALRERGDTTVIFVRPSTVERIGETVRWNPARGVIDEGDLKRIGGVDAVVNLAGEGIGNRRWTASRKEAILSSRVSATTLLVSALEEFSNGGGFLANASAIGWYGSRGDKILDETSDRGTGFLSDVCVSWERATSPLEERGIGVAHLRSGVVINSKGGALKKQLPLFRSGLGGHYGTGTQWMSPISLIDEVRALLWTIDHQLAGPVNFVIPEPITNKDFTRTLARVLRRPAFFNVPGPLLRTALGGEMTDELILVSQRVTPERLRTSGFKFRHSDAESTLRWALTSEGPST
jgi:uncharacterized protein (TIGR01777 family)